MNVSMFKYLCFVLMMMFLSPILHASEGGVIHFSGSIVEDGCEVNTKNSQFVLSCMQQGKPVTHTMTLSQLDNFTARHDSTVHTSVQYLDPQRQKAILQVTYE